MNATQEEWRPVVDWEGHYEVSNQGRVRSLDRTVERSDGVKRNIKGRLLKPYCSQNNYPRVSLTAGPRRKWRRVHTLVLEAFVGPRPKGLVACHGDGDPMNARLENLRWDTPSANNYDLVAHGNHWQAQKAKCKNGHAFTPENTIVRPEGGRKCHACSLINAARQRERRKSRST